MEQHSGHVVLFVNVVDDKLMGVRMKRHTATISLRPLQLPQYHVVTAAYWWHVREVLGATCNTSLSCNLSQSFYLAY